MKLQTLALVACAVLSLVLLSGAIYMFAIGDKGSAGILLATFMGPLAAFIEIVRRGGGVPPAIKILTVGALVGMISTVQGCAAAQKTACTIWDGTHTVACRLCEQTEGGCPFGPEQGHDHEPGE